MRVLLIEDDHATAQSIELMLKSEGFNIYTTDLGEEGIDLGKLYDYDIILLDLNLPDSNGGDTFRRVVETAPNVPVVILSGHNDEALAIEALNHGVQDYIIKKDLTSQGLSRAMRFAIHRQALLRSLDVARQQREEDRGKSGIHSAV